MTPQAVIAAEKESDRVYLFKAREGWRIPRHEWRSVGHEIVALDAVKSCNTDRSRTRVEFQKGRRPDVRDKALVEITLILYGRAEAYRP